MEEARPLSGFNFEVEITAPHSQWVCRAGFAECQGIEVNMEYVEHAEGGNNTQVYRLPGRTSFGTLTLRRGMSEDETLWQWFENALGAVAGAGKVLRTDVRVTVLSAGRERGAVYLLGNCVPVRLQAPNLNALEGGLAIEEIRLAYESLRREAQPSASGSSGPPPPRRP